MQQEQEYKGEWWLPDSPTKRIAGTLRFDANDKAILDLIGSFNSIEQPFVDPSIILGFYNGKRVTLHQCIQTFSNFGFSSGSYASSSFLAHFTFVGAHFEKTEQIRFGSVAVHFSNLDEWVNNSGFDIRLDKVDKGEVEIKYRRPNPIDAVLNNNWKLSICAQVNYPTRSMVQKEALIKQAIYIRILPTEDRSFTEYLSTIYNLQNFICLGITEPVYSLDIQGYLETSEVQIHYARSIPKMLNVLLPLQMLFTFNDISGNFENYIRNWFQKAELLAPVYDLYFGALHNPHLYLQHKFLNLIQALESYHRRTIRNYDLPEDKHEARIQQILNSAPQEHKQWLESRLAHSNELILRKRLKDILSRYSDIASHFPEANFIEKVLATRNYLTHYDQTLKEQAANGKELYRITQRLKILVEACLLSETGFSVDQIKVFVFRNRRHKQELESAS